MLDIYNQNAAEGGRDSIEEPESDAVETVEEIAEESGDLDSLSLDPWHRSLRERVMDDVRAGDVFSALDRLGSALENDSIDLSYLSEIYPDIEKELKAQQDQGGLKAFTDLIKDMSGLDLTQEVKAEPAPKPAPVGWDLDKPDYDHAPTPRAA